MNTTLSSDAITSPPRGASTPLVSVIVPAYNTAPYIAAAVQSAFDQTFRDFELIVVNDGSPDTEAMEAALAPFASRIRYERMQHGGAAAARNYGLSLARGELVAMLDSDDIWDPRFLEVMTGILAARPEIDIVYPNAVMFGVPHLEGLVFGNLYPWSGEPTFTDILTRKCCLFAQVIARRESIVRIGGYDENLETCEDFELWLRAVNLGCRITNTQEVLVRYRRHPNSLSFNFYTLTRHTEQVLQKVQGFTLSDAERTAIAQEIRSVRAQRCLYEGKMALDNGEYNVAIEKLRIANASLSTFKLSVIIFLLGWVPWLLRLSYSFSNMRRHETGSSKSDAAGLNLSAPSSS